MTHLKYPKTPRLEAVMREEHPEWKHLTVVVEEKLDGANAAVHFHDGKFLQQSRGHVLRGGAREKQFDYFKSWATWPIDLRNILGERYVVFGEWCYAKHRIYYDALPAFFIEFDVFDKERGVSASVGGSSARAASAKHG